MTHDSQERLWPLVDEFMKRMQADEEPTIEEYCDRYPEMASEIRELFPTILAVDEFRDDDEQKEPREAPTSDLPDQIAGFRIKREIGRGGMGIVYEAEQIALGRAVALKTLPARSSDDSRALARFEREGRAIAKLHHTNIVPLFEVGNDSGVAYLAMQLIQGESLDHVIVNLSSGSGLQSRSGRSSSSAMIRAGSSDFRASGSQLSKASSGSEQRRLDHYRNVASIGMQAADALDYAHTRDVIHRDVKPSNLILDESGVVWLTDFGLAKLQDDDLTQTGDFLGTLRYMAPERLAGNCDERSDVYGLGLTLYELLTQRTAFTSSDRPQLASEISNVEPPRPRSFDRHIPRDLETIVLTAIDKEPQARYSSARAMADDLHRFIHDEPIKARRVSWPEQLARWARRNRSLATAVCGGLLLLTALVLVSIFSAVSFQRNAVIQQGLAEAASTAEGKMRVALDQANAASAELRQNLYLAEMKQAGRERLAPGGVSRIRLLIDAWYPEDVGADLRGWEWYFLKSHCDEESLVLRGNGETSWAVCWSPDGSKLATTGKDGVRIWDSVTGQGLRHLLPGNTVVSADWSPNGQYLAATDLEAKGFVVWNANSGEVVSELPCEGTPHRVRWSKDSQWLATGGYDFAAIQLWRAGESTPTKTLQVVGKRPTSLDWNPDGTSLLSSDISGKIFVWNTDSGEVEDTIEAHTRFATEAAFSPDGTRIVSTGHDDRTRIWSIKTKEMLQEFEGSVAPYTVQWSPDGTALAIGDGHNKVTIWHVQSGRRLQTLRGHEAVVWKLRWSPSGHQIAAVDANVGCVRIWDLEKKMSDRYRRTEEELLNLQWSPDGEWVAAGSGEGNLFIWQDASFAASNQQAKIIKAHAAPIRHVDWDITGERIATTGVLEQSKAWLTTTAEQIPLSLNAGQQPCVFFAWAGDNTVLVTFDEGKVWVVRSDSTDQTVELQGAQGLPIWVALKNNQLAVSTAGGTTGIWDSLTGERLIQLEPSRASVLCWNPQGSKIATARHKKLIIWNAITGEKEQELAGHSAEIRSAAWSPDGRLLAVGDRSETVRLWDPILGQETLILSTDGTPQGLAWSLDGKKLACTENSNFGGTLRIWDASRGYAEASGRK